jgi:membrane associated rhomboid family serine protease
VTDAPTPTYRTGTLWAVLSVFLLIGTAASAFLVFGVTQSLAGGPLLVDAPIAVAGGAIAGFAVLVLVGLLYRVDRLRGVPHRRIDLFE